MRSLLADLKRGLRTARDAARRVSRPRSDRDFVYFVDYVYRQVLGRAADPEGLRYFVASLHNGRSFARVVAEIEASPEAKERRRLGGLSQDASELERISDGEFVLGATELLLPAGGPMAREIEYWTSYLSEDRTKRYPLVSRLIHEHVVRQRQERTQEPEHDPYTCRVMGTGRHLTLATWRERAAELALQRAQPARPKPIPRPIRRGGHIDVSAITSLYKGGGYIETFLET